MASDLVSNLIRGAYSLFAHNGEVVVYVIGAALTLTALIVRPTRLAVIYLLAFGVLAFNFEYDKHIMVPLRAQTIATVVNNPDTHLYTQRLLNLFLTDLLPVLFFTAGWGLLFIAITISLSSRPLSRDPGTRSDKLLNLDQKQSKL